MSTNTMMLLSALLAAMYVVFRIRNTKENAAVEGVWGFGSIFASMWMYGYIKNAYEIYAVANDPVSGKTIIRIVAMILVPLGGFVGWF